MLAAISRVPVKSQGPAAAGLLVAALPLGAMGLLFVVLFSVDSQTTTSGYLWWKETTTTAVPMTLRLTFLLFGLLLLSFAATCVLLAVQLFTTKGRLQKYPPILIGVEVMSIQRLAEITGQSRGQVIRDIQSLIDTGTLGDVYIDIAADSVISKAYIPKVSHKAVVACYGCGGTNELIVGIPKPCNYCGQPLLLGTG